MSSPSRVDAAGTRLHPAGRPAAPPDSCPGAIGRVLSAWMLLALLAGLFAAPGLADPVEPAAQASGADQEAGQVPRTTASTPEGPVALGVDLVSRYVWRGLVFSDAPCLQPWANVEMAGFTLGTWGSVAAAPAAGDQTGTTLTEVDLTLSRAFDTPAGTITATLSDYHFPSDGISYFEFAGDSTGGHTLEAALSISGPARLPLSLCGSVNLHRDDDHAAYLEASIPLTAGATTVNLVVGAALGESAWYQVDDTGVHVIQAGLTATRQLAPSAEWSPALKVSWILNPYREQVMLVAGLSF